ncbi:MAG: DUF742 domain-containing protein [Umezawaea sp.]
MATEDHPARRSGDRPNHQQHADQDVRPFPPERGDDSTIAFSLVEHTVPVFPPVQRDTATKVNRTAAENTFWADDEMVVRPYLLARGRVRPKHDLRLECMVSAVVRQEPAPADTEPDVLLIVRLCSSSLRSVAELAAHLGIPIMVARLLIEDGMDAGLLKAHRTPPGDRPSSDLLLRILDGLRKL